MLNLINVVIFFVLRSWNFWQLVKGSNSPRHIIVFRAPSPVLVAVAIYINKLLLCEGSYAALQFQNQLLTCNTYPLFEHMKENSFDYFATQKSATASPHYSSRQIPRPRQWDQHRERRNSWPACTCLHNRSQYWVVWPCWKFFRFLGWQWSL